MLLDYPTDEVHAPAVHEYSFHRLSPIKIFIWEISEQPCAASTQSLSASLLMALSSAQGGVVGSVSMFVLVFGQCTCFVIVCVFQGSLYLSTCHKVRP